ncbi:TPA: YcaO-like family protein, partial [Staphylococcus delphini]|nr:YcaO-like family protein [Staphylococcus delphini]
MKNLDEYNHPFGGLFSASFELPNNLGEPYYPIYTTSLGDINNINLLNGRNYNMSMKIDGSGGDIYKDAAKFKSQAEALERYSSCVYSDNQFILSSYNDLDDYALDLNRIPKVSFNEEKNGWIKRPSNDDKIRWVRGFSVTNNKTIWVPAIMTYLYIPPLETERFWLPISTGCAIHEDYDKAIISGINEVIERDAISLTWLLERSLPKLSYCNPDEISRKYIDMTFSNQFINTKFYNATTDLGIPTLYCYQRAYHNNKVHNMVVCSTELDPVIAYRKILREAASLRIGLQNSSVKRENPSDFIDVMDGALYMAKANEQSHFNFLESNQTIDISNIKNLSTGNSKSDLNLLIETLKNKGHEVIVIDLTCDEVMRSKLKSVRVIIPSLMPLSFSYKSRFLGTQRIKEYYENVTGSSFSENIINK